MDGGKQEPGRLTGATLTVLVKAVVHDPPSATACQELLRLAREEHNAGAEQLLADAVSEALRHRSRTKQGAIFGPLAGLLAADGSIPLVLALAGSAEPVGRQLALVVLSQWPRPLDLPFLQPLRELLTDRRVATSAKLAVLVSVARSLGPDNAGFLEFLRLLVKGRSRSRSIDRLRRLEGQTGPSKAIDTLCQELEENVKMSCPRCPAEMRRPDMIQHLWQEHQLVLDGRKVREPWGLIDEWIEAFRALKDPELLERCRTLAQRLDAAGGPRRLDRLLLSSRVAEAEARQHLIDEARQQHASVCPWCYALVPQPVEVAPLEVLAQDGLLGADGYGVKLREEGWLTELTIRMPAGPVYQGSEPGRIWTRRGASAVVVGPVLLAALVVAFAVNALGRPPAVPVFFLLGLALMAQVFVWLVWRTWAPPGERVRRYTWTMLAPALDQDGFSVADSAFLAGLARMSARDPFRDLRALCLPPLLRRLQEAVTAGTAPPAHLAAVQRLRVTDAVAEGADPIALVVRQICLCFEGKLPLLYAEHLLDGWESPWWTPGNMNRLRVLLCDRAFEGGYEVRNLLDAGQTVPSLGTVLRTDQPHELAALRLLWRLRTEKPWDRFGTVRTVFELAEEPARAELLAAFPDLLLYQEEPDWPEVSDTDKEKLGPVTIALGAGGVWCQRTLFTARPRLVELNMAWRSHELKLDDKRFWSRSPLDTLQTRLETWLRWTFLDFMPQVSQVHNWQSPDRTTLFRAWGARACPECQRYFLPRLAKIGVAQREDAPTAQIVPGNTQ